MPFKLIGTIILLVLVTIFCGFNLGEENRCDVSLIFYTFKNVPAFLTVLISFFAGILVMLPFTFGKNRLTKEQIIKEADRQKAAIAKKQEKLASEKERSEKKAAAKKKPSAEGSAKPASKNADKESSVKDSVPKNVNDVPVVTKEQ